MLVATRRYSRVAPPPSAVIRVTNNIAHLGAPKQGPLPRQLLSLPPFPGHPLPGRNAVNNGVDGDDDEDGDGGHVTAISWVKYYFEEIHAKAIQTHFTKGLVSVSGITFHYFWSKLCSSFIKFFFWTCLWIITLSIFSKKFRENLWKLVFKERIWLVFTLVPFSGCWVLSLW